LGAAQSVILNHWLDPNTTIQNPGIHKIVVAVLLYDQGRVPLFEDVRNAVRSQMGGHTFLL